ncbi:hypothetical protein BC628DRAFT_1347808 [Trametes gibbosa]|nr:hypothetical protein BC628DRAFT_1347808 [Trametes gibbosa]
MVYRWVMCLGEWCPLSLTMIIHVVVAPMWLPQIPSVVTSSSIGLSVWGQHEEMTRPDMSSLFQFCSLSWE